MPNQVTRAAVPQPDRSIKDYSLIRKVIGVYDPAEVDTVISPKETMGGDNYIWIGAAAAEAIITALAASRLTEVKRVLDLPCGHGRVLRHLVNMFPDAQFDACDLDRDGVNFCAKYFNARPIPSQEDLTRVTFNADYDLIWIGSLFTHTSAEITRKWLSFLATHLSGNGIIVATFHGRWATRLHHLVPYIDDSKWERIMAGYERSGYGYHDYGGGQKHEYILGSYGLSVARPSAIMRLLEDVPGIRILCYQEKGWANNHDVVTIGRPDWDESWWPIS